MSRSLLKEVIKITKATVFYHQHANAICIKSTSAALPLHIKQAENLAVNHIHTWLARFLMLKITSAQFYFSGLDRKQLSSRRYECSAFYIIMLQRSQILVTSTISYDISETTICTTHAACTLELEVKLMRINKG